MAKRLAVISALRARIISQGVADLETMSQRMSKNTTYNAEEVYSILRLYVREANSALQAGETVKIDGLLNVSPSLKLGGAVGLGVRPDRSATAALSNPTLWTADKVSSHANLTKSADELVAEWNVAHPDNPVED